MEKQSFIQVPTNLVYILDAECFKTLVILIQKENYWKNHDKLNNGFFKKSITELSDEVGFSNKKDIRCVLQALVNANLIEIVSFERKRNIASFKLNWKSIEELNSKSFTEIKEFEIRISKLNRKCEITYYQKAAEKIENLSTNCIEKIENLGTKCTTTIDSINSKKNIDSINNINNINNIIFKENNIINTIEGKFLELKDISKYIKIFEKDRNKENYDKAVEMIEMASRQKRINTFNLKNQLLALNQMIPTDMKEIIIAKPIEKVLLIDNENTSSYGIITLQSKEYSMEDFEEENDSMFDDEDVFVRLYA